MKKAFWIVLFLVSSWANQAIADVGVIDSVQLPAWLDRGGLTVPAVAGIELQPGDTVRTGAKARMLIKLSEGTAVRLGENAHFNIEAAARKNRVFDAIFNVVSGAFRMTTAAVAKSQARNLQVRVARNITIGIRGTDLWGRGREDKDIVCLIEGKIDVTGNDRQTQKLDQPLQFFQSTRTAPPQAVSMIDPNQLAEWAKETEIEPGAAIWRVVIAGFETRDALATASRQLRNAGYPAERSGDSLLAIPHIASEAAAQELVARLKAEFGFGIVTVSK
jgi:hypothetical protein